MHIVVKKPNGKFALRDRATGKEHGDHESPSEAIEEWLRGGETAPQLAEAES